MDEEKNRLASVGRLCDIVARLRGPGGCPWDGAQTHESLKPACIEEAAEVLGGIDILRETGRAENLKEELGDPGKPLTGWKEIKAQEKKGREWEDDYLPHAFEEAAALIEQVKKRKGISS